MQKKQCEQRIVCRNDFLFVSGAIAVIAGLLFPLPTHILDVLLIFSASLTAAVLIITFSAQGALQIQSFPLLIVLVTMLRMALSVACTKLILLQGNAGTIVNLFGRLVVGGNLMLTIFVFGLLVTVIFGFVCKAVKGISKTGTEFTSDVFPTRQLIIDADLNAGVVSESQALGLRAKITRETRFFVAMGGAAKFILCDAVIELVIVIVNIVVSMAMAVAASASTEMSPKINVTLAVGAGMVTQISVLITAVASDYLARKSLARSASDDGFSEHRRAGTERIKVAANEVVSPQKAELQYGRSVIPVNNIAVVESRFIESQLAEINDTAPTISFEPDEKVIAEDLGWFDESRHICGDDKKDDASLWVCREINDSSCYELIAELLESKSTDEIKTILMAADSVTELPVTMPVNIAMRLAQKNKKCLLIDLDLGRSAISKVFDVDNEAPGDNVQAKAIATCIGNLWVWPASNFNRGDGSLDTTGMKDVIAALGSRYDRLIVYAPNIKSLAHWKQVAGCINLAMLFGDPESEIEGHCICGFHRLLISCGCEVLKPAEIFVEAV